MTSTKVLREVFAGEPAGRVLDAATGRGHFARLLVQTLPEAVEVVGLDSNARLMAEARGATSDARVRFEVGDVQRLPFAEGAFDTVCMANSLHHLHDMDAAMGEMIRVLRPDGRLVILEMYRDHQSTAQTTQVLLHHWWARIDRARGVLHNPSLSRSELEQMVSRGELRRRRTWEVWDRDPDPQDPETLSSLNLAIDRYLELARALRNPTPFLVEGILLRERMKSIGAVMPTQLLSMARKIG